MNKEKQIKELEADMVSNCYSRHGVERLYAETLYDLGYHKTIWHKIAYDDLPEYTGLYLVVCGDESLPEYDVDVPIIKASDGLPTYHFAHLIDDHLMQTTHVVRGEEWLSSLPLHIQLFNLMGWQPPRYAHHALLQKLGEDGKRRKISKRLDPEANIAYFAEHGYPQDAVLEYLMNLMNANFIKM